MTIKVNNGLKFLEVALPGAVHMPALGTDDKEAARVVCAATTLPLSAWWWGRVKTEGLAN